jgi:hypothetical protein
MSKDNDKKHPVFEAAAATEIAGLDDPSALGVGSLLAWRDWFNDRKAQLASTGGRPTNRDWSLRRLVPFSDESWRTLEKLAEESGPERRLTAGQVAAFLIEDAIQEGAAGTAGRGAKGARPRHRCSRTAEHTQASSAKDLSDTDPKLARRQIPPLFCGQRRR